MSVSWSIVGVTCAAAMLTAGSAPPLRRVPKNPSSIRHGGMRRPTPDRAFAHRGELSNTGLADLALLFAVGLLSGLSVALTCRRIARTVDSPEAAMLASVVERQRRGQPLLDALHDTAIAETLPTRRGRRSAPVEATSASAGMARTIGLLRSQIEDGAAVADALLELSTSLRDEARRRAETQARRLPVRMLLPLIVCVLPGFLCLTVAPVIIESLRGVSL